RGGLARGHGSPVPGPASAAVVRRAAHRARGGCPRDRRDPAPRHIVGPDHDRNRKGDHMAEMRGCDLVVEYLIKEKVPYMFGYAGHGAVGLLDGVYNHQDRKSVV